MKFAVLNPTQSHIPFYVQALCSKGIVEENGIQSLNSDVEYSFSNEWKLKLTDPVADLIGLGLYFECTLAPAETGFEGKIILDKQTGPFVNAVNIVGEYIIGKEFITNGLNMQAENKGELNIELNYGLSYKIKDNLNIGLEVFNQNLVVDSKWENSVLLLGPCLSYSMSGFWLNLTCMPQITDLKGNGLELIDHERLQTRLVFSYAF